MLYRTANSIGRMTGLRPEMPTLILRQAAEMRSEAR